MKLGEIQIVKLNEGNKYFINAMTQFYYSSISNNTIFADYDAIRSCLKAITEFNKSNYYRIAMPRIGCGLARGDWNIVKKIIEEELNEFDVTIYYT